MGWEFNLVGMDGGGGVYFFACEEELVRNSCVELNICFFFLFKDNNVADKWE